MHNFKLGINISGKFDFSFLGDRDRACAIHNRVNSFLKEHSWVFFSLAMYIIYLWSVVGQVLKLKKPKPSRFVLYE